MYLQGLLEKTKGLGVLSLVKKLCPFAVEIDRLRPLLGDRLPAGTSAQSAQEEGKEKKRGKKNEAYLFNKHGQDLASSPRSACQIDDSLAGRKKIIKFSACFIKPQSV
jgi:hypothetical protein